MPVDGTSEILKVFSNGEKDIDLSSLLEKYLTDAGLRQLNEDEGEVRFPNFPEAAIILQHSAQIYGRQVDYLWLMVQNAVHSFDVPGDPEETNRDEQSTKRTKKSFQPLEFKKIRLEDANNIDLRDGANAKPPPLLPRAFMQFEPRVISDNDVQLKDYDGEPLGLMSDFRVNWNLDENFTLRDDMDFCTSETTRPPDPEPPAESAAVAAVSPTDSGHNSEGDCFSDFVEKSLGSPDGRSEYSVAPETPIPETPTEPFAAPKPVVPKTPKKVTFLKPTANKFDMASPLSGSVEKMKVREFVFALPAQIKRRVVEQRKQERKSIKRVLSELYRDDDADNADINVSALFGTPKKRCSITWSRQEMLKKLRLTELLSKNHRVKGFEESEELERRLNKLQLSCSRLSLPSVADDDADNYSIATSRNCADDDIPDNCYIGNQNIFEPSLARRLAQADSLPSTSDCVQQSDIAKRVEAWHASIQDKLKSAERNRKFDIKEYSGDILSIFDGDTDETKVAFSDVLKDKPSSDISRYFLTTLMLASKSKIVIDDQPQLFCGDFTFKRS